MICIVIGSPASCSLRGEENTAGTSCGEEALPATITDAASTPSTSTANADDAEAGSSAQASRTSMVASALAVFDALMVTSMWMEAAETRSDTSSILTPSDAASVA